MVRFTEPRDHFICDVCKKSVKLAPIHDIKLKYYPLASHPEYP